jgi:chaperonin GroES
MTIIPLMHRALVKPKQVETKTASGIILTESLTRKEQAACDEGIILALGDTFGKDFGAEVIPKVGDKVLFAKYAGKFIKDDEGTDLVLLNDDDLIAIVKEDI